MASYGGGHVPLHPRAMEEAAGDGGWIRVTLMFKTAAADGMLLYMIDRTEFSYVSLSLADGALALYAQPDNELVTRDLANRPVRFDDNAWHSVTLEIGADDAGDNVIRLHVDDGYALAPQNVANIPYTAAGTVYTAYVGGLPDGVRSSLRAGVAASVGPMAGCVKDVIFMGSAVDFRNVSAAGGNVLLGECSASDAGGVFVKPVDENEDRDGEEDDGAETSGVDTADPDAPTVPPPTSTTTEPFDPSIFFTDGSLPPSSGRVGQCSLPASPAMDPDLSRESGFRFGIKPNSFIEYAKPGLPGSMVDKFKFRLEFKVLSSQNI